jgi:hypothetical protein
MCGGFDARHAGRGLDGTAAHLQPFPLLRHDRVTSVTVPRAVRARGPRRSGNPPAILTRADVVHQGESSTREREEFVMRLVGVLTTALLGVVPGAVLGARPIPGGPRSAPRTG